MSNLRILDAVRFYRPLGFFADRAALSDEDLAAALEREYREQRRNDGFEESAIPPLIAPVPIPPLPEISDPEMGIFPDPHPEVTFLSLDDSRVWWEDLEQDFYAGDEDFKRLLIEWSKISRGAFKPIGITEIWPDDGPAYLQFDLGGNQHRLVPWETSFEDPTDGYGWIDLELLNSINDLIASSGFSFHVCESFDQTGYVMVLTLEERARMEQDNFSER